MVNLIKQTEKTIKLAISDDSKDIGILAEANIGISMQVKDGTQGAKESDVTIKQFFCLNKLPVYKI